MQMLKKLSQLMGLWALIAGFGVSACQSSPLKEFETITLGQDKDMVIELIGGPTWKTRRHGSDLWTYLLFEDGQRHERQIEFTQGLVTYTGKPRPPFFSAEEQDRLNAKKDRVLRNLEAKTSPNQGFSKKTPAALKPNGKHEHQW